MRGAGDASPSYVGALSIEVHSKGLVANGLGEQAPQRKSTFKYAVKRKRLLVTSMLVIERKS